MIVIGCDPGTAISTVVAFNGESVEGFQTLPNPEMVDGLPDHLGRNVKWPNAVLVLEQVESFGMAVGKEVFETVFWTGRFAQAWCPARFDRLPRRVIKQHLCHTARATDANIRQALLDRFGPVGTKKEPGLLYGIKSHAWAALAVAVTYYDLHARDVELIRPGVAADF